MNEMEDGYSDDELTVLEILEVQEKKQWWLSELDRNIRDIEYIMTMKSKID